jgi:hypothetical protein
MVLNIPVLIQALGNLTGPQIVAQKISFTVCRNINIATYCIYRMHN